MKATEFKDKFLNGDMTRRHFAKALAAVGLSAVMMPVMAGKPRAAGNVHFFTWSGNDDPAFFKKYAEKYGENPDFSFYGSEDEGLAKMRSGFKPTVGHPCSDTVPRWARSGILKGIDTSRLSNYGSLFPEIMNLPGSIHNGETVFVPFDWGNSSVLYRTDLVDPRYNEEHSWELLFDERYAGRLAMYDSPGGTAAVAGMLLGYSKEDLWAPSDVQIEAIRAKLKQQQPLLRYYWDDLSTVEQGIASGELVAAYAWSDAAVRLKREGLPVAYMTPREGILCWVCGFSMMNDAHGLGDEQAAYDMIDELLSQDVGEYIIKERGYGHANKAAFDNVDQGLLDALNLSNPAEMMASGVFFQDTPDDINAKLQSMFSEIQAGL